MDLADPVSILNLMFSSGKTVTCRKAADIDDDGRLTIGDPISLLNYLFASGPAPKAPFRACDIDQTVDALSCDSFPPCEKASHE